MNLTNDVAPFEVHGTRYGRTMAALTTFSWALLGWAVIGELPALLIADALPEPWKPLAWTWVLASLWLVARWAGRRTRVWSLVSPNGIVVHCHGQQSHLAWRDIDGFVVYRTFGVPASIAARMSDGERVQIAATGRGSAATLEQIIAYGQRVTNGAWEPEAST